MGQYYKGNKIGTCESMYYIRLTDAQEWARMGARDDDGIAFEEYITDGVTRFRFPFPAEDAQAMAGGLLSLSNYAPSFMLPAGTLSDVGHATKCISDQGEGNKLGNVNIFLPCIYSDEFKATGVKLSNAGAGELWLAVKYQGMRRMGVGRTGELVEKTIFSCARCGQEQCFTDDDVVKIKERATEYFKTYDMTGKNPEYQGSQAKYDEAMKVIARIR